MLALERVQDFLRRFTPASAPPKLEERRRELDEVVARLNALVGDQSSGRREAKDDSKRLGLVRRWLRTEHLEPISLIAKALLPKEPTIQKALAMPPGTLGTRKLIAAATAMRQAAAKYEQTFLDNGRPPGFLEQLDAAIEAVREVPLNRARNVGKHVGARAGLRETEQRARKIVEALDAMVRQAYAGDMEKLAKWRVAKRVQSGRAGVIRATGGTADENLTPSQAA